MNPRLTAHSARLVSNRASTEGRPQTGVLVMRKLMLAGAAAAALLSTGLASSTAANAAYFCRPGWGCGPYVYRPYYRPYAFARPYWYGPYRPWAYRWGYRRFW
jgi:hypothetical protein